MGSNRFDDNFSDAGRSAVSWKRWVLLPTASGNGPAYPTPLYRRGGRVRRSLPRVHPADRRRPPTVSPCALPAVRFALSRVTTSADWQRSAVGGVGGVPFRSV